MIKNGIFLFEKRVKVISIHVMKSLADMQQQVQIVVFGANNT